MAVGFWQQKADYAEQMTPADKCDSRASPQCGQTAVNETTAQSNASYGLAGYREMMRSRLLQNGQDSLQDHEILEMLLHLVQPHGDTRPRAKLLIESFGDFASAVMAPSKDLTHMRGLCIDAETIFGLVQASKSRLALTEPNCKELLNCREKVMGYLDRTWPSNTQDGLYLLFLDIKQQLIGAETYGSGQNDPCAQTVISLALKYHASTVILVEECWRGDRKCSISGDEVLAEVRAILANLCIELHDFIRI